MKSNICLKTTYEQALSLIENYQKPGNCLCIFDLDQALYKYNSGHQLLRNIIVRTRNPIVSNLAFYIEKILHKLKLPLNTEVFLARFFAPNIDITSIVYQEAMKSLLKMLENKSNYIPQTYRLFKEILTRKTCKKIVILSNTPLDLSNLPFCKYKNVRCISRYEMAIKQGIFKLHDLYKFYINKKAISSNMIKQSYTPCLVISDNPDELFEEFKIRILVKNNELYICK